MEMPAGQLLIHWTRQDDILVRSQQPALDPEGSSVTKNICPSLRRAINWDHDAYNRARRRTRWKNRLRLILLGQECFELCRVRTKENGVAEAHTFLKYGFWNSPWRALYQLSCMVSFSRLLMTSITSSPVGWIGSSATVLTTVVTSSLLGDRTNQYLLTKERRGEGHLSETFLRFFAGVLPDAAATSAATFLDLTPNTASKVVCTAARGGMVVGGDFHVTPPNSN